MFSLLHAVNHVYGYSIIKSRFVKELNPAYDLKSYRPSSILHETDLESVVLERRISVITCFVNSAFHANAAGCRGEKSTSGKEGWSRFKLKRDEISGTVVQGPRGLNPAKTIRRVDLRILTARLNKLILQKS